LHQEFQHHGARGLLAVLAHDDAQFGLTLSAQRKPDLVEFLEPL